MRHGAARLRRQVHIVLAILVLLGFAPSLASAEVKTDKAEVPQVVVDIVRGEPLNQTVPILGRFVARQAGVVAARVAGSVAEFNIDVGDRVTAGDVIAVLDKQRFKMRRDLQRAALNRFSAQFKTKNQQIVLLKQELARLKSLSKSPAFSQARLDDKTQQVIVATSTAAEAKAQLAMSRADLRLTEIDLKDAEVLAPYDGVVSVRHVSKGAYVSVGNPVVTLIGDQTMEIEVDVPTDRITGLPIDTEVLAVVDGAHKLKTRVRAVVPEENPRTRTRAVRLTPVFASKKQNFAANQSVTLLLPAGVERSVITVNKDAILNRKGKKLVVMAIDGKTEMREVTLGQAAGSRFVVRSGLKLGELVVIRGNERLRPGTAIAYATPKK